MPRGVYERKRSPMPIDESEHDQSAVGVLNRDDGDDLPSLVVPVNRTPTIDLSKPEDSPDLKDGEWSKKHLLQFLARQPRLMVFIPLEGWEAKGEDAFQVIGYMGHWFHAIKGRSINLPIQLASIIEQSQEPFPTQQSQAKKRQITDIRDLPADPSGRGVLGPEVFIS